jgi:hypothetical protein
MKPGYVVIVRENDSTILRVYERGTGKRLVETRLTKLQLMKMLKELVEQL